MRGRACTFVLLTFTTNVNALGKLVSFMGNRVSVPQRQPRPGGSVSEEAANETSNASGPHVRRRCVWGMCRWFTFCWRLLAFSLVCSAPLITSLLRTVPPHSTSTLRAAQEPPQHDGWIYGRDSMCNISGHTKGGRRLCVGTVHDGDALFPLEERTYPNVYRSQCHHRHSRQITLYSLSKQHSR